MENSLAYESLDWYKTLDRISREICGIDKPRRLTRCSRTKPVLIIDFYHDFEDYNLF